MASSVRSRSRCQLSTDRRAASPRKASRRPRHRPAHRPAPAQCRQGSRPAGAILPSRAAGLPRSASSSSSAAASAAMALVQAAPRRWCAFVGRQGAPAGLRARDAKRLRFRHMTNDCHGCIDPLPARIRQCDEMRRKIAAVHGRDVARIQRAQIPCVVPVVEMTAIPLQAAHRRERRLQTLNGLDRPCPAEVAGADGGQADTGRDWWARFDVPGPVADLPGSYPAAAYGRPPSQMSRSSAMCGAQPVSMPGRLHP